MKESSKIQISVAESSVSSSHTLSFEEWRQTYNSHLGELASQGLERKARSGVHPGRAPLGYKNVGKGIEIDPETAPLVREAFKRAAIPGMSLRMVLREMTARGLRSRNGKPLSISAIWYVLRNPFYVGKVCWRGILIPGSHDWLISCELFDGVKLNTFKKLIRK